MSDGISDANREGRALRDIEHGLELLVRGLEEVHDAAFGLPTEVVDEISKSLLPYGLKIMKTFMSLGRLLLVSVTASTVLPRTAHTVSSIGVVSSLCPKILLLSCVMSPNEASRRRRRSSRSRSCSPTGSAS